VAFSVSSAKINELSSMSNVKPVVRSNDEDLQLIHRFRGGDKHAFNLLVERYQQSVFNIIYYTLGKTKHADDLAQDIFIKVYHAIPSYEERSSFSTWIHRITVNTCIDEARRQKRYRLLHPGELDALQPDDIREGEEDYGIEAQVERNDMTKLVHEAIAGLAEPYRMVITLRDINGLSYEDMAEILRCKVGTVKSRLFNARMKLREQLSDYL
jgi:RNA polymerase sigma-70 factor (ECF subfamily)